MKKYKVGQKLMKGYSLIEILLYMGLLSLFLFSLTNLFVSSLDVKLESESTSSVEQDSRYLLSRLRYDIFQATSISVPVNVGDQGASLQITRDGTIYTYLLVDGNLVVSDGVNNDQLNSSRSQITSLSFQRLGNIGGKNTITINYTLESRIIRPSGPETRSYQSTFAIR